VPREVHETYATNPDDPDGEGILTGYVKVVRESEWDDTTARGRSLSSSTRRACATAGAVSRATRRTSSSRSWCTRSPATRTRRSRARRRADRELHEKDKPGWDDGLHYVAVPAKPTDIPEARR
jgi:hypothetical protein